MRKVAKQDEIPIKWLTKEAIAKRVSDQNGRPVTANVKRKSEKLNAYLNKLGDSTEGIVDPIEVIEKIYKFTDAVSEDIHKPKTHVCRKGCAWCCKIPVTVTALEANYIQHVYGITPMPLQTPQLMTGSDDLEYCPMLNRDTGMCDVYKARPYACRLFYSYDHYDNCKNPNTLHAISSSTSEPFFEFLANTLMEISESTNYASYGDIRHWYGYLNARHSSEEV